MKYTHGGDIYTTEYRLDFSANICPFGANEAVRQAAIRGMEMVTAYPDSQCRRLRQKLAETLKIPVEWIIAEMAQQMCYFLWCWQRSRERA